MLLGIAGGIGHTAAAQQHSPAAKLGMFPYPTKNQTKEQQATEEQQCYAWAQQQTGIDPVAAANPNTEAAAAATKAKADSATTGAAVAGAAGGAQGNAQLDTFKKAMAACLDGRGYSVK